MARQTVKRLHDLEIDEISLVDRGANQHATVAIAKRDEGTYMGIFDADGYEVDPSTLQAGDYVYDDGGEEFQVVDENDVPEEEQDSLYDIADAYENDDELVGVGKAIEVPTGGFVKRPFSQAARRVKNARPLMRSSTRALSRAGELRGHSQSAFASDFADDAGRQYKAGGAARRQAQMRGVKARGLETYGNHPYATTGAAAGGATVVTAGGVEARRRRNGVKKSLGESVYEELSKALNTDDRDVAISKALDTIEIYKSQAEDAWNLADSLADERDNEIYYEVAKSYALPVQTEVLAEIMKSAAATMPAEHVDALDRIFSSVGESLYAEIGANGGLPSSDTMEMVNALANQHVGKSDLSQEQAIVALFDANPDAYDSYIAEKG